MSRFGRSQPVNVFYSDNITVSTVVDLTGAGASSGASSAGLALTASLAGHGDASTTGTGALTVSLEGQGNASAGATAPLVITAQLAGNGAATAAASQTDLVNPPGPITFVGLGTAASTGVGNILETARIAGFGANAATGVGLLRAGLGGQGANTASGTAALQIAAALKGHGDASGVTVGALTAGPLPGFSGWYDAADLSTITVDGSGTVWQDKSANADLSQVPGPAQPSSGTRALNTLNVFDFDGVADFLSGGAVYTEPWTIFVVIVPDTTDSGAVLASPDGSGIWPVTLESGQLGPSDGGVFPGGTGTDPAVDPRTPCVVTTIAVTGGSGYATRVNGGVWGTSGDTPSGVTGRALEVGAGSGAFFYDGAVGEIIIYPTLFIDSDCATVEAYLTAKWIPVLTQVTATGASAGAGTAGLTVTADLSGHGDVASAASAPLKAVLALAGHGDNSSTASALDLIVRPLIVLAGFGSAASASPLALLKLLAALAGHGDNAGAPGDLPLFSAVPDPDPVTWTISDTGHMATIWDRGHTRTLVDSQ